MEMQRRKRKSATTTRGKTRRNIAIYYLFIDSKFLQPKYLRIILISKCKEEEEGDIFISFTLNNSNLRFVDFQRKHSLNILILKYKNV